MRGSSEDVPQLHCSVYFRHCCPWASAFGHDKPRTFDVTYPGLHRSKAKGSSQEWINKPERCQRWDSLPAQGQTFFCLAELWRRAHIAKWGRKSCLQWGARWGLLLGKEKTLHKEAEGHCKRPVLHEYRSVAFCPAGSTCVFSGPTGVSWTACRGRAGQRSSSPSPPCTTKLFLVSMGARQEDACRKSSL